MRALQEGRVAVAKLKRDFAAKVDCPVWDGYPYGHIPRNFAIDFQREVAVSEAGELKFQ